MRRKKLAESEDESFIKQIIINMSIDYLYM